VLECNKGGVNTLISKETGIAAEDNIEDISEKLLYLINNHKEFSPREWVLKNASREKAVERIWEKVNEIQKYPGYPDINTANKIRMPFAQNKYDNYFDLNNCFGGENWGPDFEKEIEMIREKFGRCISRTK
jgi:hypothetical protein